MYTHVHTHVCPAVCVYVCAFCMVYMCVYVCMRFFCMVYLCVACMCVLATSNLQLVHLFFREGLWACALYAFSQEQTQYGVDKVKLLQQVPRARHTHTEREREIDR